MADLCFGISSVHSDDESDHSKMVVVVPLSVYCTVFFCVPHHSSRRRKNSSIEHGATVHEAP